MESDSPVPTVKPQDVLDKLMYNGTFDNLRSSLIALLKSNMQAQFLSTYIRNVSTYRTTGFRSVLESFVRKRKLPLSRLYTQTTPELQLRGYGRRFVPKMHFHGASYDHFQHIVVTDDLKSFILTLVENSEVLRNSDVETKSRRQLMEELRNELSSAVLEKASTAAWELMLSGEGLGMEITEKVDETFCDLTGSSTLGCECHPEVGPSLKKLGSQDCDSSAVVNTKVVSEQTSVGSKRPREEEVEKPIPGSFREPDSAMEIVAGDCNVVVKEEHEPASCNGSTTEMPPQLKHPRVNRDGWLGSSESINDPQKHEFLGQSSQGKTEERDRENGFSQREQPSATERPSESSHSDSYDDIMSKPRGSRVV